jgi:hypothetical protein
LQGLGEARASFKQLGTVAVNAFKGIKGAIAATGIGLLLVAVGTLYAYWDDIKEAVSGVSEEQTKLNKKTEANLKAAFIWSTEVCFLRMQVKSVSEPLSTGTRMPAPPNLLSR